MLQNLRDAIDKLPAQERSTWWREFMQAKEAGFDPEEAAAYTLKLLGA